MTRQIIILLVLLPFFGMVAPESVVGEDTVYVQNMVQSSSHTGGLSADGMSGKDGQDGANGRDGKDGQDGAHVYSEESRATIKLYNSVYNDETSTYVYSSTSGTGETHEYVDTTSEDTTEGTTTTLTTEPEPIQKTGYAQQTQLQVLILTVQKIIQHYVTILF